MKATERHKLKENEFARSVAQARQVVDQRRGDVMKIAMVLIALLVAVGAYAWWRSSREARANAAHCRAVIPDAFWAELVHEGLIDPEAPVPAARAVRP